MFNPYSPAASVAAVEISEPRTIAAGVTDPELLLSPDPNRLYALILNRSGGAGFSARPTPIQGPVGIQPLVGQTFILLHNASYPGLIQGEWWLLYPGGGEVDVIEAIVKC